jgi:CheY-like chemotaxis protein
MMHTAQLSAAGRARRILLVEDNPADVRLVQEVLSESTIRSEVTVARDGVQAAAALDGCAQGSSAGYPELILLDLNLPRKSGRELLAELKRHPILSTIPVIILTSSSASKDVAESYAMRANGYVVKPLDFETVFEVVRSIVAFWFGTATVASVG